MKVCFLCYNYLTLAKALYYIREKYNDCECLIVYRESVAPFPQIRECGIRIEIVRWIKKQEYCKKNIIVSLINKFVDKLRINLRIYKEIYKIVDFIDVKDSNIMITFNDTNSADATIMKIIKKRYSLFCKIILIEEGTAIYDDEVPFKNSYRIANSLINALMGLSIDEYKGIPHGLNPAIDKIICSEPEIIKLKRPKTKAIIEKQENIFTYEFSEFFIGLIMKEKLEIIKQYTRCRIVLLTQPLVGTYGLTYEAYEKAVLEIISILTENNCVLIKKHPLDNLNYCFALSYRVIVCDKDIAKMPFEALFQLLNKPLLVTFYSSSALCEGRLVPSIFAYKILGSSSLNEHIDNLLIERTDIIKIENLDDLRSTIAHIMHKIPTA